MKTRCYLWKGNQGVELQKSLSEKEAIDVSCVGIKVAVRRVRIIHDTSESDSGFEPHCSVYCIDGESIYELS
jgi:hypothetical protein